MTALPWFRSSRNRWYVTHENRQIPLNVTDPTDVAGATVAAIRLIDQLAAGIAAKIVSPTAQPAATGPTVAEAVAYYLAEAQKRVPAGRLKPESLKLYRLTLTHATTAFGPRSLASLTPSEIEAWSQRPEWSPSYQRTVIDVLLQVLRASGIALSVHRPHKESRGAETALTDEQFAEVLSQLRKFTGIRGDLPEFLTLLRETGARPQELSRVRVDGVDWSNTCSRVKDHKTRHHTGADRVIRFNAAAMDVLKVQREKYKDGLLFRTRGGNFYGPTTIVRRLIDISERVGFRVIAYGLGRHSFATRALEAGVPDVLVAGLLGHKGTTMLHKHYSHVGENARALQDAAEKASSSNGAKLGSAKKRQ